MKEYVAKQTPNRYTYRNAMIVKKVLFYSFVAIMMMFITASIAYLVAIKKGESFTVIISNSMKPDYEVFDTVVYSKKDSYKPGNNIVFVMYEPDGSTTQKFHKLMYTSEDKSKYYTLGTNNNGSYDEGYRKFEDILGSEDYHISSSIVGIIIIAISNTSPWFVLIISIAIILLMSFCEIIQVFKPSISANEIAQLDKESVSNFQKLLSKYNVCLKDFESDKQSKKILNELLKLEVRLDDTGRVLEKDETVVLDTSQSEQQEEVSPCVTEKRRKSRKAERKEEVTEEKIEKKEKAIEEPGPKKETVPKIDKKAERQKVKAEKNKIKAEKKKAELLKALQKLEAAQK